MIRNAQLEGEIFTFDCPACGTTNSTDISEYDPKFIEEIGAFENLMVTCTNCRVLVGFNMQLPLFEAAESEGYFEYASEDDRKLREVVREIMWRRMPDLQGRDREAEEAAYIAEHGIGVPEPEPQEGPTTGPAPTMPAIPTPPAPPPAEESQEPAGDQVPAEDQEPAEETPQLDPDRAELVEEVRGAIESAIQTEEGDKNNG